MNWDTSVWIAITALILSLVSFLWNRRHSESLFQRQEYPAVAWHLPKTSKKDAQTIVTTSICNHGPRNISDIFLSALLYRGLRHKYWCWSKRDESPIGEPLNFVLTEELEKDINERFGGLLYDNGRWCFDDRPHNYKMVINLRYQPLIAHTNPVKSRIYCLLRPVVGNDAIYDWKLEWMPNWKGWLPRF